VLISGLQMRDGINRMFHGQFYINIDPVNQTALLNDQVVELLINGGQLVNGLHELINLVIFRYVSGLLQHLLFGNLKHFTLLFAQL
jgi:hypothetical protein